MEANAIREWRRYRRADWDGDLTRKRKGTDLLYEYEVGTMRAGLVGRAGCVCFPRKVLWSSRLPWPSGVPAKDIDCFVMFSVNTTALTHAPRFALVCPPRAVKHKKIIYSY